MKIVCPNCGVFGSLELFLQDAAARDSVAWAMGMPAPLNKQLMTYLGLFRPEKRSLTWDRVERILGELQSMIDAGTVVRKGRQWPVPVTVWQEALVDMITRREHITRPLKNHNYLLEIVVGLADKAEAQSEREHEQRLVTRPRVEGQPVSVGSLLNEREKNWEDWKRQMLRMGRADLVEQAERARGGSNADA